MADQLSMQIEKSLANKMRLSEGNEMSVSSQASPFGCCNYFDRCGDGDLLSLHYAGQLPLLDWIGFNITDVCFRMMEFITYVRPARTISNTATSGFLGDPCDDPNGVEWGACKIMIDDYGRIGRKGPTRDIMKPKKFCETEPIWRLDGSKIADEREWDMRFVGDQIIADMSELIVTGSFSTPGQFDGLQKIVNNTYDCKMVNSIVIDWNGNDMDGGAGVTWNGTPVAPTYNFVSVLLAAVRRVKQRISWAPRLKTQKLVVGNMIIVMPNDMIQCLLDYFTCWSVCGGDMTQLMSYEARKFRDSLLGGVFGTGRIFLDGFEIPILGYDWGTINGPTRGDIYFLTNAIGNFRIWEGEHISADVAVAENSGQGYFSTDGGRVLWLADFENECRTLKGWMHPRLFCKAPWTQIRFTDVKCSAPGGFMSPDPDATSYYPMTSFSQAECNGA